MANREEKQSLLDLSPTDAVPVVPYTGDRDAPPPYSELEGVSEAGSGDPKRKRPSNSKRERLQRNPSLEKVDEDLEKEKREAEKFGCPDYFGVKSYLHHFYDTHFYKDPSIYEDEDEYQYLLRGHPRRHRCTSIWWKVFVWIGANFLVFGIIGVLVGYLVPQRPIIVDTYPDRNIEIVDREAISFNFNLDVCKLVGLILFCIGGLTLTVALLFPSFLYQYCDDDRRDTSFKVRVGEEQPLKSPLEMTVPATSKLSSVQPERSSDEAIITQEGLISVKD